MDMIGKIRRLHARDKLSEREIARKTGLSRNTVSKWLRAPVNEAPKYRRDPRPNKLSAFEGVLKQALTADARRPKHERRTARALHAEIKAAGYDGGYSASLMTRRSSLVMCAISCASTPASSRGLRLRSRPSGRAIDASCFDPVAKALTTALGT